MQRARLRGSFKMLANFNFTPNLNVEYPKLRIFEIYFVARARTISDLTSIWYVKWFMVVEILNSRY